MQLENLVKSFRNVTLAAAMLYAPNLYSQENKQVITSSTTIIYTDSAKAKPATPNKSQPGYKSQSGTSYSSQTPRVIKREIISSKPAAKPAPQEAPKTAPVAPAPKPAVKQTPTHKKQVHKPAYAPKPYVQPAPRRELPTIQVEKYNRNIYISPMPISPTPTLAPRNLDLPINNNQEIRSDTVVRAQPGQKVIVKEHNDNIYLRVAPQPIAPRAVVPPQVEDQTDIPPGVDIPSGSRPYSSLTLQLGQLTDTFAATSIDEAGKKTIFPSDSYAGSQFGLEYGFFGKNNMFKANFTSTKAQDSLANLGSNYYTQRIEGTSYAIDYTGKIPFGKNAKLGAVVGGSIEAKNLRTSFGNVFNQSGVTTSVNNNTLTGLKAGLVYGQFSGNYLMGGLKAFQQTVNENYLFDYSPNAAASHTEKGTGFFLETKFKIPESRMFVEARYDSGKVKTASSTNGKFLAAADYNNNKVLVGYLGASNKWHAGFGVASAQNSEEWKDSLNKTISASTKHSGAKYFAQVGFRW